MDASKEKFKQEDKKSTTQQVPAGTSVSGSTPSVEKAQSSPSQPPHHDLHEVAVQADGTEDPGAGIEQMVESKVESGSSLQPSSTPDIDPTARSHKVNPGSD